MEVLSLFDGISCARVALERAGIPIKSYTAYEIDKRAIEISKKNYPSIIHKGDVKQLQNPIKVDLLIGGSPCTDLSRANNNGKGLEGERSKLFWEYVRILKLCKPTYFILENVASMKPDDKEIITRELGVNPIMIDAGLVSAQIRRRYFWTNITTAVPDNRNITLRSILEPVINPILPLSTDLYTVSIGNETTAKVREATKQGFVIAKEYQTIDLSFPKSKTRRGRVGDKVKTLMTTLSIGVLLKEGIRMLTTIECERLQSLPDNYTSGTSDRQRIKCLGNAFNVEVVAHILRGLLKYRLSRDDWESQYGSYYTKHLPHRSLDDLYNEYYVSWFDNNAEDS